MIDQYSLIIVINKVCVLEYFLMSYRAKTNTKSSVLLIFQALNELRKKTPGKSHHAVNLGPFPCVSFDDFLERVKSVVDAGDHFSSSTMASLIAYVHAEKSQ